MKYCLDRRQMVLGVIMIGAAGLSTALLIVTVSSDHLVFCIELYKGNVTRVPYLLPKISPTLTPYMSTNIGFWRTCNQFTGMLLHLIFLNSHIYWRKEAKQVHDYTPRFLLRADLLNVVSHDEFRQLRGVKYFMSH